MEPARRPRRHGSVKRFHRLSVLVIGLVLLAACGSGSGPSLDGRTFLSTAVTDGGAPFDLVPNTRIRLSFTDGQLGASAGCNTIGGTYRIDGDTLVFEGGGMTEMGCDPDRHAQDDWLSEVLGARPTIVLTGNDLSLTAGDVVIRLLDREVADPDLALVGTLWTVDSIFSGGAVSSVPAGAVATIRFDEDGRVSVNTGCNSGQGSYEVTDGTLRLLDIAVTEMACPGDAGALESAVLPVLGADELTYAIEAGSLTLMAGDIGLGLRGS
jgi:heat shock protein HslJ